MKATASSKKQPKKGAPGSAVHAQRTPFGNIGIAHENGAATYGFVLTPANARLLAARLVTLADEIEAGR